MEFCEFPLLCVIFELRLAIYICVCVLLFHLIVICEGTCGSDHPHASIYDVVNFHFEITGK